MRDHTDARPPPLHRDSPARHSRKFNYDLDFAKINFRDRPDLYRVGVGEQGVLLVEPYKSEILPYWRFRSPAVARESAEAIFRLFQRYLFDGDFVGADMARKFLQMGFTRARRYANHRDGRKVDPKTGRNRPQDADALVNEKAEAARIFYEFYVRARETPEYKLLKSRHLQQY